jgi:hypothetical protein
MSLIGIRMFCMFFKMAEHLSLWFKLGTSQLIRLLLKQKKPSLGMKTFYVYNYG